jgi:hypothetical protein
MLPFKEEQTSSNEFIRIFSPETPEMELKWHWDQEDRIIEPIGKTDWFFQFDNLLPEPINKPIFIPRGIVHRIIKGQGDLIIKVYKLKETIE